MKTIKVLFVVFIAVLIEYSELSSQVKMIGIESNLTYSRVGIFQYEETKEQQELQIYSFEPDSVDWELQSSIAFPNGDYPYDIKTGDIIGNGIDEIVVTLLKTDGSGYLAIYWDANEQSPNVINGSFWNISNIRDIDGDGYADFFVSDYEGNIYFYKGNNSKSTNLTKMVDIAHHGNGSMLQLNIAKGLDNSSSHFLSVGNPYQTIDKEEQGAVYVYKLNPQPILYKTLKGQNPFSHLGYRIASANIDGENFDDLVVTALDEIEYNFNFGYEYISKVYYYLSGNNFSEIKQSKGLFAKDPKYGYAITATDHFKEGVGGFFIGAVNMSNEKSFNGLGLWWNLTETEGSKPDASIYGSNDFDNLGWSSCLIKSSFISDSTAIAFYNPNLPNEFQVFDLFDTTSISLSFKNKLLGFDEDYTGKWITINANYTSNISMQSIRFREITFKVDNEIIFNRNDSTFTFRLDSNADCNNLIPSEGSIKFFENKDYEFCYRLESVTSVNDEESKLSLHIFPNPTENIINLKIISDINSNIKIEISDINGIILLKNEKYVYIGENKILIDNLFLSSGKYFIRININNSNIIDSFIITR